MIVLDENFVESQRHLLRAWQIRAVQIGYGVGRSGMKDDEIPRLLAALPRPTLFTKDLGFYRHDVSHSRYCIVCLDVGDSEAALFARKVLRHRSLDTSAKRMGKVVRAVHSGLTVLSHRSHDELRLPWVG